MVGASVMCRSAQKQNLIGRERVISPAGYYTNAYTSNHFYGTPASAGPDAGKERSEESRPRSSTRRINRLQVFAPVAADFSRAVCRCRCLAGRGFSRDRNPAPQRRTLTSRESRRPPDAVRARRCLSPLPLPLALRRHSACPDAGRERSEESLPFKAADIKASPPPRRNKPPYESSSSAHGLSRAKQNAF